MNQKQVLTATAVVHEKIGREQSVRGAFSAAGLAPVSDEAVAGGAIQVLHYSMSVSTAIIGRLIPDLLHNGYGLTRKFKYQLGFWEDENS
jgi:restriction endonuclease Mrr